MPFKTSYDIVVRYSAEVLPYARRRLYGANISPEIAEKERET